MRLTKTAYLYGKDVLVGYDQFGRPVYKKGENIPFDMEIEPYSTELAKTQYGIIAEVNYRIYINPDSRFTLNTKIVYRDEEFNVQKVWDYDRHYELLIKRVGEAQ